MWYIVVGLVVVGILWGKKMVNDEARKNFIRDAERERDQDMN